MKFRNKQRTVTVVKPKMGCSPSKPTEPTNTVLPPAPKPVEAPHTEPVQQPVEEKVETPAPAPIEEEPKVVNAQGVKGKVDDAFKLLLCGAGESGKTTFTRQLKLRFLGSFSEAERADFVDTIRGNIIETIQMLCGWIQTNEIEVPEDLEDSYGKIMSIDGFSCDFDDHVTGMVKELWNSDLFKEAFKHRDETDIPDHMDYFLGKIDELAKDDYSPTDDDILRARIRTVGYEQVTLTIDGAFISIYDVGGQLNERSKWSKVKDMVDGAIVCASFADFDRAMFENKEQMRFNDSLEIFHNITHYDKYQESPIFFIANKYDGFIKKVRETDAFGKFFPEYSGDIHDPEACSEYLIQKFIQESLPEVPDRPIKVFKLSALDPSEVVSVADEICKFISDNYYS